MHTMDLLKGKFATYNKNIYPQEILQ